MFMTTLWWVVGSYVCQLVVLEEPAGDGDPVDLLYGIWANMMHVKARHMRIPVWVDLRYWNSVAPSLTR